jgi:DNA-directed RNA polymerase subunit RPC12/RpoP
MDNQDELLVVDLLVNIFGESHLHNEMRAQISFDCPVCSHDIKGSDKGDGKGNLEINYGQHVYKCWACSETHGTHGHLGRLIDKYGSKKDK